MYDYECEHRSPRLVAKCMLKAKRRESGGDWRLTFSFVLAPLLLVCTERRALYHSNGHLGLYLSGIFGNFSWDGREIAWATKLQPCDRVGSISFVHDSPGQEEGMERDRARRDPAGARCNSPSLCEPPHYGCSFCIGPSLQVSLVVAQGTQARYLPGS